MLERADTVWAHHDGWQHTKERIPEPPSTYYYGRVFGCFTADRHGLKNLDEVGRRQHLLRDRLPAHRHHVAGHEGLRREDARRTTTSEVAYKVLRGNAIKMLELDRT